VDQRDDQPRLEALASEVERLRAELDASARLLVETERRGDRRRDRLEGDLDRRDRLIELAEGRIQRREMALAAARGELARPLVRRVARLDRLVRRAGGRLRRILRSTAREAQDVTPSDDPGSPGDWRRTIRTMIGERAPRAWLVGESDMAEVLRRSLETSGWEVAAGVEPSGGTLTGASADVHIALSPDVRLDSLPERSLRIAWAADVGRWLADPRFDDYDLVLAADPEVATSIARGSAHRPATVVAGGAVEVGASLRSALLSWIELRRIAIHIPPKDQESAPRWGDTHFARGLQRAFAGLGWIATVHVASESDSLRAAAADIAIHIHGLSTPAVRQGQPTALWIISHPDRVRAVQIAPYDIVFVASDPFATELARRVRTPVRTLHQATDPECFYPESGAPGHDVLFVGNSRGVRRPVLDVVGAMPYDVAVYGGNWRPELIEARLVRGAWIPNSDLHRYYASASIVLSDHWPDMREEGFIANRVYDALASGAFVVSDRVAGIDRQFEGAVATYGNDEELREVIDQAMADPADRHQRAERGRAIVLAHHTFEHRARTIIEAFEGLAAV
jgi:glycosyltransferase involved in cell wall biosynthesis